MLKTPDKRCFFTHKNNYPQLIEFARTCDVEISVVKGQNIKILDLAELAKSICSHTLENNLPQYELVEIKIPPYKKTRTRHKLLSQANIISDYVKQTFFDKKIVSLGDLETKFSDFNLSKSALSNHISRVRKNLEVAGYKISKLNRGKYKLVIENNSSR